MAKDAPGMRGNRSRNQSGPLRRKRGDTRVSTIEAKYDIDFGVRGDMRLDTLLNRLNADSLKDALQNNDGDGKK